MRFHAPVWCNHTQCISVCLMTHFFLSSIYKQEYQCWKEVPSAVPILPAGVQAKTHFKPMKMTEIFHLPPINWMSPVNGGKGSVLIACDFWGVNLKRPPRLILFFLITDSHRKGRIMRNTRVNKFDLQEAKVNTFFFLFSFKFQANYTVFGKCERKSSACLNVFFF